MAGIVAGFFDGLTEPEEFQLSGSEMAVVAATIAEYEQAESRDEESMHGE
jgi:hypothetical protein